MKTSRRVFVAAAMAPLVTRSVRVGGSAAMTGPELERRLEAGVLVRGDIPTPALVLDLDAFEWNVSKMAGFIRDRGRSFRPHGKTHKCPEVAKALIRAGAVGACTAKLSEAEVFADHGVGGLLVTTQVVGRRKIERAIRLAARQRDTIFVIDNPDIASEMNDLAATVQDGPPLGLNLAVDLLYGRTGVEPGEPAFEVARAIDALPHARFAGIQAYDGAASHTMGFDARSTRTRETMGRAVETRRLIERHGMECPLLSGGSTGTYNMDSEIDGVTELQPGSFVFMDIDYNRIGGREGPVYRDFRNALSVLTTVVSRRPGVAIVDGGLKAFSTDRAFPPEAKDLTGVTYAWAGDEHGRIDLTGAPREVKLGDRLEFIVPHCDPSVNLYDEIFCLRGDKVEAVWQIAARGRSQ